MQLVEQFISFLKNQKNQPSKATIKNYKADVSQFIRWFEERFKNSFDPNKATFQIINLYKDSQIFSASSIERHLSSLRKFFNFLKLEGIISQSPLEMSNVKCQMSNIDPYRIKDFKDFLYVYNASHLTIKNYIIDVKQFFKWAEEVTDSKNEWDINKKNVLGKIDSSFIEEYKNRLLEQEFLPSTVNRKLSSLRKYFSWAQSEGLLGNGVIEVRSETSLTTEKGNLDNLISDNQNVKDSRSRISNFPHQEFQSRYSSLPPVRLAQKFFNVFALIFDYFLVFPLAKLGETFEYVLWQIQGKPVFQNQKSKIKNQNFNEKLKIGNLSKALYAPLSISTKSFPWHKKAWHHLRHTRPNWYRTYHSYPITHYFHLAILIIFMTAVGFAMYNAFATTPRSQSPAFAAPVAPPRILSFQGRLTDSSDNPVTTAATALRMAIYNDPTASGAALLWQEIVSISPDTDGIFSILLGNNTAIAQSIFAQNATLYLGVTVGSTAELTPRQQLATVAFATNAEVLQGLPPVTDAGVTTNTNAVLALNSSGTVSIAGTATTTFQAASGQLTITGKPLVLQTNSGTAGNITFAPDGLGTIDLQKPIQNSTNNNNISTAVGALEVDDLLAILATSSGQSALTINQTSTGPLISASTSGTAKFTVDNSGNVGIGTTAPASALDILGSTSGNPKITFRSTQAGNDGTASLYYNASNHLATSGRLGVGGNFYTLSIWQYNSGQQIMDFSDDTNTIIKSSGTNNGDIQLIPSGTGTIDIQKAIRNTTSNNGGAVYVNDIFAASGNVGIGITAPGAALDVRGLSGTLPAATVSAASSFASLITDNAGVGDLLTASKSGATKFVVTNAGNVGIGINLPAATLDIVGTLKVSGTTNFGGIAYTWPGSQTTNYVLQTNGSGTLSWVDANAAAASTIYWNQSSGLLYPKNSTVDLTIGGQSTASAKFAFINVNSGNPTASISGNLSLAVPTTAGANTFNLLNNSTLNFQRSPGGDAGLAANSVLFLNNNGNIGIGTTSPSALFSVGSSSQFQVNSSGAVTAVGVNSGSGLIQGTGGITVTGTGNINATGTSATNIGNSTGALVLASGGTSSWTNTSGNLTIQTATSGTLALTSAGALNLSAASASTWTLASSSTTALNIASGLMDFDTTNSRVGIGTTAPLATLDIRGLSGTLPAATISATSSFASLITDNAGVGDLFTASKSGAMKFVIQNSGNVGIATASAYEKLEVYGGNILLDRGHFKFNREAAPADTITYADSGVAGNLNGTYSYGVSFVTASGESGGTNSGVGVSVTNKKMNVSNIPIGSSAVIARKIYRTAAGGANPRKYVATISDNTTTTYTDNLADAGLGAAIPNQDSTAGSFYINEALAFYPGETNSYNFWAGLNTGLNSTGQSTFNTGVGVSTLKANTTGSSSTAVGALALTSNTTASNDAFGFRTLFSNSTGGSNVGLGSQALYRNDTGSHNIGIGANAEFGNNNGNRNTVIGSNAFVNGNSSHSDNIGIGYVVGDLVTTGSRNVLIGSNVATTMTTGSDNILIGYNVQPPAVDSTYKLNIGGTIYGDLSTDKIGIGTVTPLEALDITGNATISGTLAVNTIKPLTGALNLQYKSGTNAWTNGLTLLDNNGNVGIGTTAPQFPLEISKAATDLLQIHSTTGGTGNQAYIAFTTFADTSGAVVGRIGAVDMGSWNGSIVFETANSGASTSTTTERMRIKNDGSVGIGTTSPLATLDLRGNLGTGPIASFSGRTSFAGLVVDNGLLTTDLGDLITASSSAYPGQTPSGGGDKRTQFRVTNGGTVYARSFYDLDNSAYFLDPANTGNALIVNGNIGIGTTSPGAKLQAISAAGAGSWILNAQTTGLTNDSGIWQDASNNMQFAARDGSNVLRIVLDSNSSSNSYINAGNVGIGNTSPLVKLDVTGSASLSANLSLRGSGTAHTFNILDNGTLNFTTSVGGDAVTNPTLFIKNGGAATSGNVGIGTTAPAAKLDVNGAITINNNDLKDVSNVRGNNTNVRINFGDGGGYLDLYSTSRPIRLFPGNSQQTVQIGNVGSKLIVGNTVNDADPVNDIAVNGNQARGIGVERHTTSNTAGVNLTVRSGGATSGATDKNGGDLYLASGISTGTGNSNIYFQTFPAGSSGTSDNTATTRMIINSSGNVGIGTTSPLATLDIRGSSGTTPAASVSATTSFASLITDNAGVGDLFTASKSGATKFVVTNAGGVIVNLPAPATTGALCHTNITGITNEELVDCSGAPGDIAEWYVAETNTEEGDIVALTSQSFTYDAEGSDAATGQIKQLGKQTIQVLGKSTNAHGIIGVYSTGPFQVFGEDIKNAVEKSENPQLKSIPVALNGRVPVKVSMENGPIQIGDPLTSSSTPGVAMKATKAGPIVAKALEPFSCSSTMNPELLTNNQFCQGRILVFVNVSWYDPDVFITSTGDYSLASQGEALQEVQPTTPAPFVLKDPFGNIVDRIGAFAEIAVGNLKVGFINAQEITTNSLAVTADSLTIGGETLRDYIINVVSNSQFAIRNSEIISPIASIDSLKTNFISPLASNSAIAISLDSSKFIVHSGNNASSSAVAVIDNAGNASFAGVLTANELNASKLNASKIDASEASVSGTLRAKKIIADQIEGLNIQTSTLSAQYITNNYYDNFGLIANSASSSGIPNTQYDIQNTGFVDIASLSGQLAYVENLNATFATFTQGLISLGPSSFSDLSVINQLSVGGDLVLADTSINVLGSDLKLQPLKQGNLSIMDGLVYIDTFGNIKVGGNAEFAKDVTVKGIFSTNIISPIPGSDLVVRLNQESAPPHNSSFIIHNSSDSAVLAINQQGDVTSSGSATFSKLNLRLVQPALAISNTEFLATGSAGVATISANFKEITINNSMVTDKSLIYLTPVSLSSLGGETLEPQTPYLMRQLPDKSFTVGIQNSVSIPTTFNWLIIN